VTRNYYRPRVNPRTGEIVAGEQSGDRWRVARVSPDDGTLRYADPDDGVTRYDATWTRDGRAVVVTSEATGIANLERIDSLRSVTRLTSVTGAAVAADVAPDGALWFLSLHAAGFDLRRLPADSATVRAGLPASLALGDSVGAVLPPRLLRVPFDASVRPERRARGEERDYGMGPSRLRYVPGVTAGHGGATAQVALVRSDPVGRLSVALIGAAGSPALPAGGALTLTRRASRTQLAVKGWLSHEAPSRVYAPALDAGLDLSRAGAGLRLDRLHASDGGDLALTLGALTERLHPSSFESSVRGAGLLALRVTRRQRDETTRYEEAVSAFAEVGGNSDGRYLRQRAGLLFGTGTGDAPLSTLRAGYGSVGGGEGSARESYVLGGGDSPLMDPLFDARRVDAPAYPVGSATGRDYASFRVGLPVQSFELFYSAVGTDLFRRSLRSMGAELRERVGAVPAIGTPDVDILAGVARASDEPVKGEWRVYLSLAVRP
jgi:hypothetical protein